MVQLVQHLEKAFIMVRSCVNCAMGYSAFELVYSFKPNVVQANSGMKLVIRDQGKSFPQPNLVSYANIQA